MEEPDSLRADAARFLRALSGHDTAAACRLLERTPALARSSIHTAAALCDAETVRQFLAEAPALATEPVPDLDVEPLILAVMGELPHALQVPVEHQLDTVRALLDAGASAYASVAIPDASDRIPALYFPCVRGNVAVARLLLERGANPTDGESLYHAAQHDHRDCLALLVEFGADVNRGPAEVGNTPLYFLATHTPDNRISASAMRGLAWLLEHGADPSIPSGGKHVPESQQGETPLHRAAAVGHGVAVLQSLVEHGAPVNARRDDGLTAYRLAARAGHAAGAAYLASVGSETALTPLDTLLAACANGAGDEARRVMQDHPGLLEQLGPGERDALGLAVTRNDFAAVQFMTSLGWPLTQEGQWGGTPLHWAAWNGRVAMVRLLLAAGAPVNVRDSQYGSSPIAWCAHGSQYSEFANDEDYPAIIHLLLDAGATRPESFNRWNESPESMARPSVVAALQKRGFLD